MSLSTVSETGHVVETKLDFSAITEIRHHAGIYKWVPFQGTHGRGVVPADPSASPQFLVARVRIDGGLQLCKLVDNGRGLYKIPYHGKEEHSHSGDVLVFSHNAVGLLLLHLLQLLQIPSG